MFGRQLAGINCFKWGDLPRIELMPLQVKAHRYEHCWFEKTIGLTGNTVSKTRVESAGPQRSQARL